MIRPAGQGLQCHTDHEKTILGVGGRDCLAELMFSRPRCFDEGQFLGLDMTAMLPV